MTKTFRGVVALLTAVVLTACGGGGGGGGHVEQASLSETASAADASFGIDSLDVSSVEGTQTSASVVIKMQWPSDQELWVYAEERNNLVVDGSADIEGDNFLASLKFSGDLPVGMHDSELVLHLCQDEHCDSEFPGSPKRLPIHYQIKPNIQVRSTVNLERSGRDPAPSQTLTVTIPVEAGQVVAQFSTVTPQALSASLSGDQLTITTTQVKSGTYTGTVLLASQTDDRYRRSVNVTYTVTPPPGGEVPLSVDPPSLFLGVRQGQTATARFKVTRPSWTSQAIKPSVVNGDAIYSVRDLGNDEYELQINGVNAPSTVNHWDTLRFSAGPTATDVDVSLNVSVIGAFQVGEWGPLLGRGLDEHSTQADYSFTAPVRTNDGVPATWTASAKVPWITLTRSTGTAGVDDLAFKVDPAHFLQQDQLTSADVIDVAIDRPGVPPVTVTLNLRNQISRLDRVANGALLGTHGRVYISGRFNPLSVSSALLAGGYLHVDGATLDKASIADQTLILDVSGAQVGRPLQVSWVTNLQTTHVAVNVLAPPLATMGYQALPYGTYRAAQYSPALRAFYWSGNGKIFRWSQEGAGGSMTQMDVGDVADMAVSADGSRLYTASGRVITGYDPVTLAYVNQGDYIHLHGAISGFAFETQTPPTLHALGFLANGRSFASVRGEDNGTTAAMDIVYIEGGSPNGPGLASWDLAIAPHTTEMRSGTGFRIPSLGAGMLLSPGGQTLAAVMPDGWVRLIDTQTGYDWRDRGVLPAGTQLAALSDDGTVLLRTDGVIHIGGFQSGSLATLLPAAQQAGGYGLTADGRYALVYAYRVAGGDGGERATDAAVWIMDLQGVSISDPTGAKIVGAISLPGAIGCTGTPVAGETCRHTAQLTVDGRGETVLIVGPRGVATLPLAAALGGSGTTSIASSSSQVVGSGDTRIQAQSVGGGKKPRGIFVGVRFSSGH